MKGLERTDILDRTVPPLAKLLGCTKERAWELLKSNDYEVLARFEDPLFRNKVNDWWKEYHHLLSPSLGICNKVSSPSKLPSPTYEQIMCLAWLTDQIGKERFIQRAKEKLEGKREEIRPTFWQRFLKWIKSF